MPTLKLSPISILISLSDEPDGRDSLFLSTFELMIMCLKSITGYSIKAFKDEKCKLKNETVLKNCKTQTAKRNTSKAIGQNTSNDLITAESVICQS